MSYRIPGKVPLWIDSPNQPGINWPIEQFRGWVAVADTGERLQVMCEDVSLPVTRAPRPDLAGRPHISFSLFIDLAALLESGVQRGAELTVRIIQGEVSVRDATLSVSDRAWAFSRQISQNRRQKAQFIARYANRPLPVLAGCRAPSALPEDWPVSPRLADRYDLASAHFYGQVIREFLESLGPDAMVLDAGAGLRRWPARNVINMEIYDYPSTDILAIGQDIPFNDDSFDAALSLAVLEHVSDPFICAKELIRVVKPGGRIMCIIPFLQAEHGFPSHYFNATQFGMRELFKDGTDLETHFLERSNQPIFVLHQILRLYAAGLPQPTRAEFLQMKIGDLLSRPPDSYIEENEPIVEDLAEAMRWQIASGTTAIFRKRMS